jgi:hypothetical protein
MKELDATSTIFELTSQYPELIEILAEIGFLGVKNPMIRKTLGKKTSLIEGCRKQGKDLHEVKARLREQGFVVRTKKSVDRDYFS